MILNPVTVATIACCTVVIVTKPSAILEGQAAQPDVFNLRHWLNRQVNVKILAIREALRAIVAFSSLGHAKLELTNSPGNADTTQILVIPVKHDTATRAAGVKTIVAGMQIIFSLRAGAAGTLTGQAAALGILHFHTKLYSR